MAAAEESDAMTTRGAAQDDATLWEDAGAAEDDETALLLGEDVVNYMGVALRASRAALGPPAVALRPNERVVLFQVDAADAPSPAALAQSWLDGVRVHKRLPTALVLPPDVGGVVGQKRTLEARAREYKCDYLKALGDEWTLDFSAEGAGTQFLGSAQFLGRIWITSDQ